MSTVRAGVVGLGKMGLLHTSLLNAHPDVEVVAACETNRAVRHFGAAMLPWLRIVGSVGDLATADLDAVFVATPPTSHFLVAKSVLDGAIARHIFVEKPLSMNYTQAAELCRMARERSAVTMVGYLNRFNVVFQHARSLMLDGAIGEVRSFQATAYSADFLGAPAQTRQSLERAGALRDLGCHIIDVVLWYLGSLQLADSGGDNDAAAAEPHGVSVTLATSQGIRGSLNVSTAREGYRLPEFQLELEGTAGRLSVNADRAMLETTAGRRQTWHRQDFDDTVYFMLGLPEYAREVDAFVQAVRGGESASPDFCAGAEVDRVITDILRARG